jgi:hypothetical protein
MTNLRYDLCPICGNRKRSVSQTCRKCRYQLNDRPLQMPDTGIHHDLLSPGWLAEFRGLFWGEGSAMIVPNQSSYSAILALNLRADDISAMQDIQARLGGFLVWSALGVNLRPHTHPQVQWRATRLDHVREICQLLLADIQLSTKKTEDVRQVLAFCDFRLPNRYRPIVSEDREKMREMFERLRQSRIFGF